MLKQICNLGKWFVVALLLVLGISAGAVHAASYDSLAPKSTDALWGTTDSPWQAATGTNTNTSTWLRSDSSNEYSYIVSIQTTAAELFGGSSTDTYPTLQFSFSLPSTIDASGNEVSNLNTTRAPSFSIAAGTAVPSLTSKGTTIDYSSDSTGKYSTKVTSAVITPGNGPIKATEPLTLKITLLLKSAPTTGLQVVTSTGTTATDVPQVIKVFARDSVTGANIGTQPQATFGEGEALGATAYTAKADGTMTSNGTTYRYAAGQLFNNESSTPVSSVDSSTLSIADLKTSLLKQAVMFWYDAKDDNIPVYYVDENNKVIDTASMSSPPTSTAWGYNNANIYKAGTTTEDSADLLKAPDTLTSGDSSYKLKSYDYYSDTDNSSLPTTTATASGTDVTTQKLAGQVGKQAIVFHYQTETKAKFGVHYWNIDTQSATVPTSNSGTSDEDNPTGLTFAQLTGDKNTAITGGTTDPIDTNGSGGVAAAKAPAGWYYVGYNYNDGSGTNKWVAYDPSAPSTAWFKGEFTGQDQGISFLYRQYDQLSLILPSALNFGTLLPGNGGTTALKSVTANGSESTDSVMIGVQDERAADLTNANLDDWQLTVTGTTLTATNRQVKGAQINFKGEQFAGDKTTSATVDVPLDGTTMTPVLNSDIAQLGDDAGFGCANTDVQLSIPVDQALTPGDYHSTLTWTLTAGY
ncbi:WxL domain-containing protein [Loigolactobacillus jiayinensis]|uniref:WxL domain-containing protein n=1 Tax=Loigolactobacillus jiayinensis TaxID=2486016 RepID=A0ABW1RHY3_9LACO|nr:WxL domain-containing protein [Loigolactobacillus jiayinensis]